MKYFNLFFIQIKNILALWKELREVRQKQGYSNTTTKIIIRKVSSKTSFGIFQISLETLLIKTETVKNEINNL